MLAELVPDVIELARQARRHDLNFTVDAEEADRLELTLEVIAAVLADRSLRGWEGFGLAVQAYQKRAPAVIDWLADTAHALGRRLMVRLVKGAYWDTEVKRAQERGLADYPVFTRKAMTDLCYTACARKLLAARPRLYPQFATHNALTVASVIEDAGGVEGYEFQRLHGMGEVLYELLLADHPDGRLPGLRAGRRPPRSARLSGAAAAGERRELVVRVGRGRSVGADRHHPAPAAALDRRSRAHARHPKIPLPRDLYAPERRNSSGVEFGDRASLDALLARGPQRRGADRGGAADRRRRACRQRAPAAFADRRRPIGRVREADAAVAAAAMAAAQAGFAAWAGDADRDPRRRARTRQRSARGAARPADRAAAVGGRQDPRRRGRGSARGGRLLPLLRGEARRALAPQAMPGPTGESNELHYRGRGVFVCISPWNFPLAIFLGQVSAALAAGNAVVAKPAEQTPLIAAEAVRILHQAGIPASALALVPGDGKVGAALVADRRVAGVGFTGSTEVGRAINRALAAKDGPIVPLIAETGGINAMIVDATALPEQVTDDVVTSAFRSAGQRCSALRLLCVQEDVADHVVEMIAGAARELKLGDPRDPATHVGPVIDAEAKDKLDRWIAGMEAQGRVRFRWDADRPLPAAGTYVPPAIVALDRARDLQEEVFGPILHVVRWRADELDALLDEIAANGYGLTLGIHSRIDATVEHIVARLAHGNVYVNRNMIGAVVGTQPFGGTGLSGTGPKAGGPNYLRRFATEQVVTINTAAAGGNASLLATEE